MDPFLEAYWPDVHTRLMIHLSNAVQPQLPDGLFARVEESLTIDADGEPRARTFRADVLVAQVSPGRSQIEEGGVAVAEPDLYRTVEEEVERRVEIIDVRGGGGVVTVIEVLSPSNKTEGRAHYRGKQQLYRDAGINLVEIDLIRAGAHTLAVPPREIPPHKRTHYAVCATRGGQRGQFWVWHIGLLERLPAITIPLRPDDREPAVDLAALLEGCYRDGCYDRVIDYRKPLDPPLPAEAAAWLERTLGEREKAASSPRL